MARTAETAGEFASQGKVTAVVSTINGDANVPFYKEFANQGIMAEDIPVVAFSVGEEELAGLDTAPLVGHLAAWNYFRASSPRSSRRLRRSSACWPPAASSPGCWSSSVSSSPATSPTSSSCSTAARWCYPAIAKR